MDTTKTIYITNKKLKLGRTITPAGNRRLTQWRVKCKIENLCFYQAFVQAESEVLLSPPLRQAPKRYFVNFPSLPTCTFVACADRASAAQTTGERGADVKPFPFNN